MRLAIEIAITSFLVLSLGTFTSARSIKLRSNPLGLDYDPAPPPDKGPPLSAGALRDPAYLPAEIGGIVGAYVFIVSVVGVALFTVGRRLRLATERSKQALDVEMIQAPKVVQAYHYPSPLSPTSAASNSRNFSWPSPEKSDQNPYIFPTANSPQSPCVEPALDIRVLETDRQNLHKGLEDLYAHVMAHEEAKAASRAASTTSLSQPPLSPRFPMQMQRQPLPSTSPQRPTKNVEKPRPSGINTETRSQKSQSRTSSLMSSLSRKKGGVRTMQISSPIPTPLSQTFSLGYASDEEPLSPIHYKPPPPPPIPKDQVPYTHSRDNSSNTNDDNSPTSSVQSIDEQLASVQTPTQKSYKSSQVSLPPPPSVSNPLASNPSKKPLSINTRPNMQSNPPSSNNSTRTLPFRAFDPPAGLSSPTFAQTTKTTLLERKAPALLSPGLKTPWTAGAVPYSPYQPQTPCTPYTPTLVTRQDRKAMKKLQGRAPVLEMIKSEEELWDSGL